MSLVASSNKKPRCDGSKKTNSDNYSLVMNSGYISDVIVGKIMYLSQSQKSVLYSIIKEMDCRADLPIL